MLLVISCTGWWLTYSSEKYEFVSWDDEIPNIWKNKIMFQATKTSVISSRMFETKKYDDSNDTPINS